MKNPLFGGKKASGQWNFALFGTCSNFNKMGGNVRDVVDFLLTLHNFHKISMITFASSLLIY